MSEFAIVADLGGTNARFAVVGKGSAELHNIKKYSLKSMIHLESF